MIRVVLSAPWVTLALVLAAGCGSPTPARAPQETLPAVAADVLAVEVRGEAGAYTFSVEIASPDTGCDQYADWWEVVSEGGELLYRRVLAHSHVDEQPFRRSGGPIAIDADTVVWVRAHMHPGGYGGTALKGSVRAGFEVAEVDGPFAPGVEALPPHPDGCAF
jgi:hypothetical protein